MADPNLLDAFSVAAQTAGAEVVPCSGTDEAINHIVATASGPLLLPPAPSLERLGLPAALSKAGCDVLQKELRDSAPLAAAGLTGVNFAIAETGTVVLESTAEDVRLASTLPQVHIVLLDPRKVISDSLAATPIVRRFHQGQTPNYLAYITGPSRTADIERVLTIGVHGPKELHILLLEGLSEDPMEQ